jgi:hypothetical protein
MSAENDQKSAPNWLRSLLSAAGRRNGREQAGEQALKTASQAVKRVAENTSERSRIRQLIEDEHYRTAERRARLEQVEGDRIRAIAAARIAGNEQRADLAESLRAEAAALRQAIDDSEGVVAQMGEALAQLETELQVLKRMYLHELGAYLTNAYGQMMERYNALAPDVAEIVLQIAAMRRVMMLYKAGNSNGWDGGVLLPSMRPGEGRYMEPMLVGDSRAFAEGANARMDAIIAQLKAAGFEWRFD